MIDTVHGSASDTAMEDKCPLVQKHSAHQCSLLRHLLVELVVSDEAVPVLIGGGETRVIGSCDNLQECLTIGHVPRWSDNLLLGVAHSALLMMI